METKKDDNMILTTHEPNIVETTPMIDIEEKYLARDTDFMPEEAHTDIGHHELKSADEGIGVKNISGRILFLNKAKMEVCDSVG